MADQRRAGGNRAHREQLRRRLPGRDPVLLRPRLQLPRARPPLGAGAGDRERPRRAAAAGGAGRMARAVGGQRVPGRDDARDRRGRGEQQLAPRSTSRSEAAQASELQLTRMREQLAATLGITTIVLSIGGGVGTSGATATATVNPQVDGSCADRHRRRLRLSGRRGGVVPLPTPQRPDRGRRRRCGHGVRAAHRGLPRGRHRVRRRAPAADAVPVDDRPGLLPPALDPYGFVWTVPSTSAAGIAVHGLDGAGGPVLNGLAADTRVVSMDVSRDGTRLLLSMVNGDRPAGAPRRRHHPRRGQRAGVRREQPAPPADRQPGGRRLGRRLPRRRPHRCGRGDHGDRVPGRRAEHEPRLGARRRAGRRGQRRRRGHPACSMRRATCSRPAAATGSRPGSPPRSSACSRAATGSFSTG